MSKTFFSGNIRLQNSLRCLPVLAALLLTISVSAVAQPTLEWELVNPFKFISDQKSIDELRAAYKEIKDDPTPYNLERRLQKIDEDEVSADRKKAEECQKKPSEKERKQCLEPLQPLRIHYSGWFSRLAENKYAKTCWDVENLKFRNEGECENYIHPTTHKVRVWINNFTLPANAQIEWYMKDERKYDPKPCGGTYQNCIVLEIPYDRKKNGVNNVSVKIIGLDSEINIRRDDIKVKDKLIVGLGDSYASGEGNPDIPAHFEDGRSDIDIFFERLKGHDDTFLRREPKRDKDSQVAWLDRRCHRSMYSYQFKTALHLALSNPQEAITYVSYSCSGAVTKNLINKEQKAKEPLPKKILKGEYKSVLPQIGVLKKALCPVNERDCVKEKQRGIDYLLLSIGGNDIGFDDYVAYIITSGLIKKLKGKKPNAVETGDKIKGDLARNYRNLHEELLNKEAEKGLNINGCKPDEPCKRILLTAYPDVTLDKNKKLCEANRGEFDIPFGIDTGRKRRIEDIKKYVFDSVMAAQKQEKIPFWTVVNSHSEEYATHGFCAQGDIRKVAEIFMMPTRNKKAWKPFEPKKYKAYESKQRWIRLPIDSKLTTDQVLVWGRWSFRLFYIDDTSNVFHPTAEGHTAIAQANVLQIRNIDDINNSH